MGGKVVRHMSAWRAFRRGQGEALSASPGPVARDLFTTRIQALHQASTPVLCAIVKSSFAMPRVLIVEDDELIAKGMSTHLAEAGFDPLWMGKRRGRARATSLRAARRLRPRPDDAAPRRLEADRDRPGRGHRHPDRRRQRRAKART